MSDWKCNHAPSGCNYPEGECAGLCMSAKQAEPVAWVDPLPEGWKATNAGPCVYLTDEANRERRVQVERVLPPFEGKDRLRSWCGPDLYAALKKAHESLDLEYETPAVAQEPVEWVDLLHEAQSIVESKSVYKKLIKHTPLDNDIAVWMADFAESRTHPAPAVAVNEKLKMALMMFLCAHDHPNPNTTREAVRCANEALGLIEAAKGVSHD